MSKTPSLDDLARFRKVTEKGSFVAAARDLGIPKSTLSKAIARLESDLGVRLLERTTRNMRPTGIGRVVATHGKDMIDAFEAARAAAAATEGPSGRLRISCPPGLLESLVDDLVIRFLQNFPKVDIDLQISGHPVDLITDDVDIALRARAKMEAGASFVVRRLATSRGILVAADFLLRTLPPISHLKDIAVLPTLCLPGDNGDWTMFDEHSASHAVSVSPRLVTSNIDALKKAAVAGVGIAQLPEHLCSEALASGRLERVLPNLSTVEGTIYAVFSRETSRLPTLRAFIDHLALEFGKLR